MNRRDMLGSGIRSLTQALPAALETAGSLCGLFRCDGGDDVAERPACFGTKRTKKGENAQEPQIKEE